MPHDFQFSGWMRIPRRELLPAVATTSRHEIFHEIVLAAGIRNAAVSPQQVIPLKGSIVSHRSSSINLELNK